MRVFAFCYLLNIIFYLHPDQLITTHQSSLSKGNRLSLCSYRFLSVYVVAMIGSHVFGPFTTAISLVLLLRLESLTPCYPHLTRLLPSLSLTSSLIIVIMFSQGLKCFIEANWKVLQHDCLGPYSTDFSENMFLHFLKKKI